MILKAVLAIHLINFAAYGLEPYSALFSGIDGERVFLESALFDVGLGTVIIVSEYHDNASHHENQVTLLNKLATQLPQASLNVGMEFLYYPQQEIVDAFLEGEMDEETFKKEVSWKGNFDFYRTQILFPKTHYGITLALNAPRFLTKKVAANGLNSLNEDEKALLPPGFELGNDKYFERFRETMNASHPMPEPMLKKYFEAHSIWDDTMAWKSAEFLEDNPESILVIIVGDFHAAYGGGLPDRLRARGVQRVLTFSQIDITGLTLEESTELILPHTQWGQRADYVWVSQEK